VGIARLRYRFDNFSVDTRLRELRRGGELVSVEPQVFDVLEFLLRNRDRVVTRDDLVTAVWKGRIISESAMSTRINGARSALGDTGRDQRLIKTLLRKGIRFVGRVDEDPELPCGGGTSSEQASLRDEAGSLPLRPDKPSIAVLPFQNLGGDPEQDYFADGMVEEITTALSRMHWLFVIARNSSFTYKGRTVDVKQVGRELGVRYVLEGSVRKSGGRIRISGQLIDAAHGTHIWADRFDGALENVFDLQDQITQNVICAIAPTLEQAEIERAGRKPTRSLDAYDHYLRGLACIYRMGKEANYEALPHFYRAIDLDPNFASAHGIAAWCLGQRKASGWSIDRAKEHTETERLARRAAILGRNDAAPLRWAAWAIAYVVHDLDAGAAMIDRALVLNPNLGMAWNISGFIRVWLGDIELALVHLERAMRLSMRDPLIYNIYLTMAHAHYFAGRYSEASSWAAMILREQPNYHPALRIAAAAYAFAEQFKEALDAVERLRGVDPTLCVSNLRNKLGPYRPAHLAKYEEGLRRAGLPE
jgi:TolB-like protein